MTRAEAFDVLMYLRAGLPNAFLKLTEADTDAMVALWAEMFQEYPAGDVMAAAKAYIWQDTTGRFPGPGNIRHLLEDIQESIEHYSYGIEYLGASAKKYPSPVRAYIISQARDAHEKRTGRPLPTPTERLAQFNQRMLADGRTEP